jgi:Mrp family chromosome partitioning ATPase
MSTTDQAFIRAYQQEIAPSNSPPPHLAQQRQQQTPTDSRNTPRPIPNSTSAGKIAGSPASEAAPEPTSSSTAVPIQPVQWRIIDQVDIGLGSIVPPPHANFRNSENAVVTPGDPTPSSSSIHSAQPQPRSISLPNAATLRAKLRHSPKASLSTFANPIVATAGATAAIRPALEIDAIRWPSICEQLADKHGDRIDRLVGQLQLEAEAGRQAIAITGLDRGEGRTTLALCTARQLAIKSRKVALVDANFASPQLAHSLGLTIERGWESTLTDNTPIGEILIESLRDSFTIAPLGRAAARLASNFADPQIKRQLTLFFDQLKSHFDLVLIDADRLDSSQPATQLLLDPSLGIDAVVVAYRSGAETARRLAAACLLLAEAGMPQLGIAELQVVESA